MDVEHVVLDDYEAAMDGLLEEIRDLKSVNGNLQAINERLEIIQGAYKTAGIATLGLVDRTKAILKDIETLELADILEKLQAHYQEHQESLASLDQSVKDAVREQQRLGLEMLQLSTANQKEFDAFAKVAAARDLSLQERLSEVETSHTRFQDLVTGNFGDNTDRLRKLEYLIVGSTVFLFIVVVVLAVWN